MGRCRSDVMRQAIVSAGALHRVRNVTAARAVSGLVRPTPTSVKVSTYVYVLGANLLSSLCIS